MPALNGTAISSLHRRGRRRACWAALLAALFLVACTGAQNAAAPTAPPAAAVGQPPPEATAPATALPASTATAVPASPSSLPGSNGLPWWNDRVFYEVFVRSFQDSDGDGIGDLNGLIERLDYLEELGVSGLWLMPITTSPSYHGYDVVDYYQVDPDYGTNEDFLRLVEEAHARNMPVIVDLVLNHTSNEHSWFTASNDPAAPERDWYVWSDEDPGYRGPANQKVWHAGDDGYYYGVFWHGMPDLNLENPEPTAEMHEVARYWLEEMGADGFRLDAIKHLIEDGRLQEKHAGHPRLAARFLHLL